LARRIHHRTCCLCEASCGLKIELDGDQILSIRGDEEDPLSRGYLCPKATALQDLHEDPDRIRRPLKKEGDRFVEIGWDEAFELAARRIHEIQSEHGNDAAGIYVGNPTVHNHGAVLFGLAFMRSLKTKRRFSATSVDQLPHMLVSRFMFGHQLLLPIPDVDRTQHLLIIGANPLASNGSLMTAPGFRRRMQAIRERGGSIVVVDPRRTETAKLADEHHFVRPGSDAVLLLAMLHVILGEKLGRGSPRTTSFRGEDRVRELVSAWTPERAAGHTGLSAEAVRSLARAFANAESAVCYGRIGTSTQAFGSLATWGVYLLNALTGNLDRPGGAMFPEPAVDLMTVPRPFSVGRGSFRRWTSEVRGLPEFGGELPVATLAEEILDAGDKRLRCLVTNAGNPALSTPNGRRVEEALASLDFLVSVDFYVNETTRHADLILPPVSALERSHYDLVFHLLAVRNTVKYSPPLFDPPAGAKHDWQIWAELTRRIERLRGSSLRRRLLFRTMRRLGPDGIVDLGLRYGKHGRLTGGLTLNKLRKDPHGIDLGPLQPVLARRLTARQPYVELAPDLLVEDLKRLEAAFAERDTAREGELLLIGRRQLRNNNSWMHNVERLAKGPERCTLLMHPQDAALRDVPAGATVRVSSRVGAVEVGVAISDEIMPGVVSLPHGFGHDRPKTRLSVASARPGASINDLTDEQRVDALSGVAAFSGVPVRVELVEPVA
jgi:anaerobic selenocysteine-containing dehydrogenase